MARRFQGLSFVSSYIHTYKYTVYLHGEVLVNVSAISNYLVYLIWVIFFYICLTGYLFWLSEIQWNFVRHVQSSDSLRNNQWSERVSETGSALLSISVMFYCSFSSSLFLSCVCVFSQRNINFWDYTYIHMCIGAKHCLGSLKFEKILFKLAVISCEAVISLHGVWKFPGKVLKLS